MKTIEQFAKETFNKMVECGEIANNSDNKKWVLYLIQKGVDFAQQWIPVEEELPEMSEDPDDWDFWIENEEDEDAEDVETKGSIEVLVKNEFNAIGVGIYNEDGTWYEDNNLDNVTHWRPIERK